MKTLINKLKIGYCRWLIVQPEYHRNRAIEAGETYGALVADYFIEFNKKAPDDKMLSLFVKAENRYYTKMQWHIKKAIKSLNDIEE